MERVFVYVDMRRMAVLVREEVEEELSDVDSFDSGVEEDDY